MFFITNRPAYGHYFGSGIEPGISGVYLVRSSPKLGASTTRSSYCPKMGSMPAIVTTGRVFHHQPPPVDFFGSGIRTRHIRRIFSPFSFKAWSLNHPANLLPNMVFVSHSNDGTCFSSPTAQPIDFFGSGIRTRHIRRMFSPFSSRARSLNHSAILLPKCGLCQP